VDIAHMSDLSQIDTLSLASRLSRRMPVINSHTDLRGSVDEHGSRGVTERKLLPSLVPIIKSVGGMVGLGTESELGARSISREQNSPLTKLSDGQTFQYHLDNPRLRVAIGTGGDNLDDGAKVRASVVIGGTEHVIGWLREPHNDEYEQHDMEEVEEFANDSVHWVTLKLPAGTKAADLQKIKLELVQGDPSCQTSCSNWKMNRFEAYFISRTEAARLASLESEPWIHYFKAHWDDVAAGETPVWSTALSPDGREVVDVEITTGGDGVDNDKGFVELQLAGGGAVVDMWNGSITPTNGMFGGLYFERPYALPAGKTVFDVAAVRFGISDVAQPGCGLACDNWDVGSIRVTQPHSQGTRVLVERSASPAFRFSGTDPNVTLLVRLESEPPIFAPSITAPNAQVQWLQIAIQTETDDLQYGVELTGELIVNGVVVPPFSLNQGAKWFDGTSHMTIVKLPKPVRVEDIRRLDIHYGSQKDDEWKIGSIDIQALGKPMAAWYAQYQKTLELMGGGGIAIGTDLNGMNPLVPFSEIPVSYPLAPPAQPVGYVPLAVQQTAGNRTFDFEREGISNVGQLPEFMQAIQNVTGSPATTEPLFRSAHDFVEMWKKIEAAAAVLP
jgi:hypothetical protein